MKRLTSLTLIVGFLAAGCAGKGSGSLGPAPTGSSPSPTESPSATPTVTPTGTPTVTPTPTGPPFTFEVWFLRDGKLFVTHRTEPFQQTVATLALNGLLTGPNAAEGAAGIGTAFPDGIEASIAGLVGGRATVRLSDSFYLGDERDLRLREAQVVYTLTQYSTIEKVRFTAVTIGVLPSDWNRKSFDDLLPAILVESPVIGQSISSPVTISGTANVFEATVSIRILDESGNEVANTFTTATCGTGCRGDYSVAVTYSVDHAQRGTIEVFESSAKDGSAINVQSIPVTLTP